MKKPSRGFLLTAVLALAMAGTLLACSGEPPVTPVRLSDVAAGNGGFVITETHASYRQGRPISDAGDVNGDGLDDLLVGATGSFAGRVDQTFVVFGKTSGTALELSSITADSNKGGFVINGSGYPASAGDVNGDGLDDIILDKNWNKRGTMYESDGESYVVFGKVSGTTVELSEIAKDDNTGGFRIDQTLWQWHGRRTTNAGDVNGDGLNDLIVEDVDSSQGNRYVVFGKTSGTAVKLHENAAEDHTGAFLIYQTDPYQKVGQIDGAGDVNGDGLADVTVRALILDTSRKVWTRETYFVFGKANGAAVSLSSVADGKAGFCIVRRDIPYDSNTRPPFGTVRRAGDVNGDGLEDIIFNDTHSEKSHILFSPFAVPKPSEGGK